MRKLSMACVFFLGALCCRELRADLIVNGNFEVSGSGISDGAGRDVYIFGTHNNSINGWTLGSMGDVYLHHSPAIGNAIGANFNFAQDGQTYLDLSGGIGGGQTGNHATIFQDISTSAGSSYELRFFTGAAFAPSPTINVRVDGVGSLLNETLTAPTPSTNIVWSQQSFTFLANSALTRISFQGLSGNDDNVSFIDNVSVTAVPEPSSLLLTAICGLAALLRFSRTTKSATNKDLTSRSEGTI